MTQALAPTLQISPSIGCPFYWPQRHTQQGRPRTHKKRSSWSPHQRRTSQLWGSRTPSHQSSSCLDNSVGANPSNTFSYERTPRAPKAKWIRCVPQPRGWLAAHAHRMTPWKPQWRARGKGMGKGDKGWRRGVGWGTLVGWRSRRNCVSGGWSARCGSRQRRGFRSLDSERWQVSGFAALENRGWSLRMFPVKISFFRWDNGASTCLGRYVQVGRRVYVHMWDRDDVTWGKIGWETEGCFRSRTWSEAWTRFSDS